MALEPSTMLAAEPPPEAVASLLVVALTSMDWVASTERLPATRKAVSSMREVTSCGSCTPKLEPTNASMPCLSRFCGFQPMVLKARVTPTAVPPEAMMASLLASIRAPLSASTVTEPPVERSLRVMPARAPPSTTLLAIRPLIAIGGLSALAISLMAFSATLASACDNDFVRP